MNNPYVGCFVAIELQVLAWECAPSWAWRFPAIEYEAKIDFILLRIYVRQVTSYKIYDVQLILYHMKLSWIEMHRS